VDPRTIAPNQTRQRRREEERDKFSFGRAGSVRPTEFPLLESAIVRHTFRRTFSMRTRTLLPRGSRSEQQRENSCREAPVNLSIGVPNLRAMERSNTAFYASFATPEAVECRKAVP